MSSCWPLFSNDLDLARDWIEQVLDRDENPLQAGHQALSLGMQDVVLRRMQALLDGPHAEVCQRQWGFRLARMRGDRNPYKVLFGEPLKQAVA